MGVQALRRKKARRDARASVATYAAIVFLDEGPFMVAGFVAAPERDRWAPQFASAARTVTRAAR